MGQEKAKGESASWRGFWNGVICTASSAFAVAMARVWWGSSEAVAYTNRVLVALAIIVVGCSIGAIGGALLVTRLATRSARRENE